MGDGKIQDELTGGLTDPFGVGHMGITAENLADKYDISRQEQDEFALLSQQRAVAAISEGRFAEQIVPYELKLRKGVTVFDTDEHPREGSNLEGLSALRAVFKDGGSVTAGNASGINDGASMLVLATEEQVISQGVKPMARVVSYGRCGVPNEIMGIGPVGASTMALERAGLKVADMDVIESNEAFAARSASKVNMA